MSKPPQTIWVHTYMLSHFVESTLNFMPKDWRFVLISGGADLTVPRCAGDVRWSNKLLRGFSNGPNGGSYWQRIVNDPRIVHYYAENHDLNHPKVSTLPTAMSVKEPDNYKDLPNVTVPIHQRPLLLMVSDRVRDGRGQWALRYRVSQLCDKVPYCIKPFNGEQMNEGVSHKDFLDHVAAVPFLACVQGGGMDPSPKAWESILVGTIPIIVRSTLDDAYEHFPVAFIDSWDEIFNNPDAEALLESFRDKLAPYYLEGSALRKEVLHVSICVFY